MNIKSSPIPMSVRTMKRVIRVRNNTKRVQLVVTSEDRGRIEVSDGVWIVREKPSRRWTITAV